MVLIRKKGIVKFYRERQVKILWVVKPVFVRKNIPLHHSKKVIKLTIFATTYYKFITKKSSSKKVWRHCRTSSS